MPQIKLIGTHFREEARQHNDYKQFCQFWHLDKLSQSWDGDPALGAEMSAPNQQDGDESGEANEIKDGSLIENQMIIQARKREHQKEADDEPAHLFHVHAGQRASVRGGIDF